MLPEASVGGLDAPPLASGTCLRIGALTISDASYVSLAAGDVLLPCLVQFYHLSQVGAQYGVHLRASQRVAGRLRHDDSHHGPHWDPANSLLRVEKRLLSRWHLMRAD